MQLLQVLKSEDKIPSQFKKLFDCAYEFNCSSIEAKEFLIKLGFRESKTLEKSHILDKELLFEDP